MNVAWGHGVVCGLQGVSTPAITEVPQAVKPSLWGRGLV
jgi:hypothetical protein